MTITSFEQLRPETVAALQEMMRLAAKQFFGYEGPLEITIHADRWSDQKQGETNPNVERIQKGRRSSAASG